MATPVAEVVKVNWTQIFPWLALFRAFGLALRVRQILVGVSTAGLISLVHSFVVGPRFPREVSLSVDWRILTWVWAPLIDLAWGILACGRLAELAAFDIQIYQWWQLGRTVLSTAMVVVIGGLGGGVLVRRAAVEFAREESPGLIDTVRFVIKRSIDYVSAPSLTFSAVLALGLMLTLAGLLCRFVFASLYVVSLGWGLVVCVGMVMTVLLLATLLGWPLMIAAVSINGSDGFDALSRGFGFVIDRWRYYSWCLAIMTAYGSLSVLLLLTIGRLANHLAIVYITLGFGVWNDSSLPAILPRWVWAGVVDLLMTGYAYSFFWTSMAVIYLVLRKSVDNAEMTDIYIEGASSAPSDLQPLLNPQIPSVPTLLPIIDPPPRP